MIPVELYNGIFFNFMLLIAFLTFAQSTSVEISNANNLKSKQGLGMMVFFFLLIFIGTRPVSGYFVDMRVYATMFESYASGSQVAADKDIYFEMFTQIASQIMSIKMYFFTCACLYLIPIYFGCKKMFGEYWYYGFVIMAASYTFWSNGTNGIRSGIGLAFCFYAIANRDNRKKMIIAFLIGLMAHKSVILVIASYIFAYYFRNTKLLLYGWLACIVLSFALGNLFENLFIAIGLGGDDRLAIYFADGSVDDSIDAQYVPGFRWDFLLYSALAVFAGWYYIFKKEYHDKFYRTLFGMFLCSNGFWVLVIQANFSNRFAALSWFFMGIIMLYPLLKVRFSENQHALVGKITLLFFGFTYIMLFILGPK